jgi:hypothetical protein
MNLIDKIDRIPNAGNNPHLVRLRDKLLSGKTLWAGEVQIINDAYDTYSKKPKLEALPIAPLMSMLSWGEEHDNPVVIKLSKKLITKATKGELPTLTEDRELGWLMLVTGVSLHEGT